MKKNYILLFFIAFFLSLSFQAQVVVGEGTVVNEEMPIEPYYKFSYSQVIYLANEINASGSITGLKYTANPETDLANSDGWDIWIGHTSLSAHGAQFVDISELTQVFSGNVTIANQVVSITLDTAFEYNGTDNLMVAVNETSNVNNAYDASTHDFYCTATTGVNRGLVTYTDSALIDPSNVTATPQARESYANITFEGITQSCSNAQAVTVTNVTDSTAEVSWTSPNGDSWEYIVLEAGESAPGESDTGTSVSTTYTTLTGLNDVTSYIVYVRTVCSSEVSGWIGAGFTTDCAQPMAIPFHEGFNGDAADPANTTMPAPSNSADCWTVIDNSPSTAPSNQGWVVGYLYAPYEGDRSARLYTNFNVGENDDWLISPQLNLTGQERLKFRVLSADANDLNHMEVLLSQNTNDPADFTEVIVENSQFAAEWTQITVDLSAYSSASYIAFHVPPSGQDGNSINIDEIIVEVTPSCPEPTNVTIFVKGNLSSVPIKEL